MTWAEGDRLINVTYKWVADKHAAHGSPMWVTGECCGRLEAAIEHVYTTRNHEAMKAACKAFGHHMVEHFKAATALRPQRAAEPVA